MKKTADWDTLPHLGPAIPRNQFLNDGFQGNPVQRVAWVGQVHNRMENGMELMPENERLIAYSILRN